MRLLHNAWLKALSLLIAIGFWIVVVPHETMDAGEDSFLLPVKVVNVPTSLLIMGDLPESIQVRLRGDKAALEAFAGAAREFTIDLADSRPGRKTIPILPEILHIPKGLEPVSITPVNLQIDLQSRLQKLLPITAQILTKAPRGKKWEVTLQPDKALVTGPESVIQSLNSVATVPLEFEWAGEPISSEESLTPPHSLVRILQPTNVTVTIQAVDRRRGRGRK